MLVPHLLYFFILFFVHVHVGPMDRAICVMASTKQVLSVKLNPPSPTVLEILDSPLLSFFNTQCSSRFHTLSNHIDSQQCDWRQLFKVYSELQQKPKESYMATYHLQPLRKLSLCLLLNSPQLSAILIGVLVKSFSYILQGAKQINL